MTDKTKIASGFLLILLVVAGILAYVLVDESIDLMELVGVVVVPLLLVFGAAFMFWRKAKSVKSGLPVDDELSKKVAYKAGYYAFIASIYTALAGMFFELEGHELGAAVVLVSSVVFMASYLILERRGGA